MNEKKLPIPKHLEVENFNPEDYVVPYVNNEGKSLTRLPFPALNTWFHLVYPEGKIATETRPGNAVVIAKARIYANRNDNPDAFIAEAEASRGVIADAPGVNPRVWAQTAAISTALRYAGFGLNCDLMGEEPEDITAEWDELLGGENKPSPAPKKTVDDIIDGDEEPKAKDFSEMTDEEAREAAVKVICTRGKYKGKTLGEVIAEHPDYTNYVLQNFNTDDEIYKAAKVLNDAALRLAGF